MKNWIACLVLLAVCAGATAAEVYGTVDALTGSATVTGQDGSSTAVTTGLKIYEQDTVTTGHEGEVHIVTEDGGIIALRPGTVFRVDEYKAEGGENDRTFVSLLTGGLRSITGWIGKHNNSAYRVTTPTATVGVRGTDHEVTVIEKGDGDEPGTYDTVNEGATVMKTPHGEVQGEPGKFVFAPKGRAAAPVVLVQHPRFWAARRLRMEERIQQRKEYFRARHEQMREERIRHFQQVRTERRQERQAEGRNRQEPAMEKRNESRGERAQRLQQRREEMRERRREKLQKEHKRHKELERE
ncbi:MAG TPA: FecR domain-containing protein [Gallionellaceae bacterium]